MTAAPPMCDTSAAAATADTDELIVVEAPSLSHMWDTWGMTHSLCGLGGDDISTEGGSMSLVSHLVDCPACIDLEARHRLER